VSVAVLCFVVLMLLIPALGIHQSRRRVKREKGEA